MDFPAAVLTVVALLYAAGARVVTVMGGAVVDTLLGRQPLDYDMEAFGLSASNVMYALQEQGYEPKRIKAEHNGHEVVKCTVDGVPIDIAAPEMIGERETARRRDLTINSIFYGFQGGACMKDELVDYFYGQQDLEAGVLRATSEYFKKTPANVLRIAQFLSRGKGRRVDPATWDMCWDMAPKASTIPGELVKTHLDKLLMGAKPREGMRFLGSVLWMPQLFPELHAIAPLQENPEWHPEGGVWEHTLRVLQNAAVVRHNIPEEWQLAFMYAALLHDVGKAAVDVGDRTYKGHDKAGEPLALAFMERLKASKDLTAKVVALVGNHMQAGGLTRGGARPPAWKRLHNKVRLDLAGWLSRCDWAAHPDHQVDDASHEPSKRAFAYFEEFGVDKIPPKVQGRHLIRAGLKPGPNFRQFLDAAYELQLENPALTEEELVAAVLK